MHVVDGRCCVGHKLAKDLVTCEKCGTVCNFNSGRHVNSRNKEALLAAHGMQWLPYTVEQWALILSGNWDRNIYPWDRQ